jgi:hypothetical protein
MGHFYSLPSINAAPVSSVSVFIYPFRWNQASLAKKCKFWFKNTVTRTSRESVTNMHSSVIIVCFSYLNLCYFHRAASVRILLSVSCPRKTQLKILFFYNLKVVDEAGTLTPRYLLRNLFMRFRGLICSSRSYPIEKSAVQVFISPTLFRHVNENTN